MYIIFEKESKKVVQVLNKKPASITNDVEIAICDSVPKYNPAVGEYLTVTNLQEKSEKYIGNDFVEKEVIIDGETLTITEAVEVEKQRPYLTCDLTVNESPNKAEFIERQYENKVSALIRKKYSLNAELAILRQRDIKPEEYQAYNDYAEQCKTLAKQEMQGELK